MSADTEKACFVLTLLLAVVAGFIMIQTVCESIDIAKLDSL